MRIVQISVLPDGTRHIADLIGPLGFAVDHVADHYMTHAHPDGGYVGIAPVPGGAVVQLHAPDGSIESYRIVARANRRGPTV